jgi:hypothetical protein
MPYYENGIEDDSSNDRLAKRRFYIPLSNFAIIDSVKMKNEQYAYQPFKKASQVVEKFDGKNGNYLLKTTDVDCVAVGIGAEDEIVSNSNIIVDKFTGKKAK